MKLPLFSAAVTYRDADGRIQESVFPVRASDHATAKDMAFAYVVEVLKLKEFELRVVGG